ncbi:uncharacterized protein LOC124316001 [Daphnia pulicaria]|uniref:uncharacterized protein LOC124316001 n=1 Tax=Daphnia pulicaria TaxID=35523 RepID=UPI001EEBDAC2|nr:uncharacterized protein LOC124316001 [Daphnia pulicaria]XP_046637699.1 uncharacterized protein LOC124316001 [Daphnia pulicaria]XP_046637708.1 uncharacterized protein LOC124316001 [Daphnia pulicaria]XP_046637716.1 uncharacterized protein LOC124316001 [Daphnia pulicaria]XP_046637723.1 uncharacterized protein LOC124316001 [Daphnia pulicaria]XP_046637730.1 uncharacterized protein LOC124316001 [Daphnia pulicaria]XP_046637738.1 uncharacterized protein LOC124316001 [Daphnia pulicaria]XP_04663774
MEETTSAGGNYSAMTDSEVPITIDFPLKFSVGFERTLPSLDHLFKEYREATEEKARFQLELDHETQLAEDLQLELNYYQTALDHKARTDSIPQLGAQQLCSIEAIHNELTSAIKALEEQLISQDKGTQAAIEVIKQSAWKMAQTDEQEFQEKLNEIQAQFNGEMEIVRQNLKKKENKLKAAKDKAEVEHSKRKEELRKSLANKMKADSHHIECRSAELDLRKRAARLEKEIQQLEQQQKSKRKLPLSFTAGESPRTGVSPQTPNNQKGNNNNKGTLTPHPSQISSAGKEPQSDNLPRGITPKRKLFSLKQTEYPDF